MLEELYLERARLLVRLRELDVAIESYENGTPRKIITRKNLRNTYLAGVIVYADPGLSVVAKASAHRGFVSAEGVAILTAQLLIDDDYISLLVD